MCVIFGQEPRSINNIYAVFGGFSLRAEIAPGAPRVTLDLREIAGDSPRVRGAYLPFFAYESQEG